MSCELVLLCCHGMAPVQGTMPRTFINTANAKKLRAFSLPSGGNKNSTASDTLRTVVGHGIKKQSTCARNRVVPVRN